MKPRLRLGEPSATVVGWTGEEERKKRKKHTKKLSLECLHRAEARRLTTKLARRRCRHKCISFSRNQEKSRGASTHAPCHHVAVALFGRLPSRALHLCLPSPFYFNSNGLVSASSRPRYLAGADALGVVTKDETSSKTDELL